MESFRDLMQLLNLLFIPGLIYIIKLEKRFTKVETIIEEICRERDKTNK